MENVNFKSRKVLKFCTRASFEVFSTLVQKEPKLKVEIRDVGRPENDVGRVVKWGPKIWGGLVVRVGQKSGEDTTPLPPCFRHP